MQSGRRAEVLLGVEVRRLAQRADPDPVDGVAAVQAAGLGLHDRDVRTDDQVLEQGVGPVEPRRVALVGVPVPHNEAVLIELTYREVERRTLAAARQRQRILERVTRLEDLGAVVVRRRPRGELRPPREETRADGAVHREAIGRYPAAADAVLALHRQRPHWLVKLHGRAQRVLRLP